MKKLTLKHVILGDIVFALIISLPVILFFILVSFSTGENPFLGKFNDIVIILALIALLPIEMWLIFKLLPYGLAFEGLTLLKRYMGNDRKYFLPYNKSSTHEELLSKIQKSLKSANFRFIDICQNSYEPELFAVKRTFSFLKDRLERILIVYYCEALDKNSFSQISSDVKVRIGKLKPVKIRKNGFGFTRAISFCIIADSVVDDLERKAKKPLTVSNGEIFPCIYNLCGNKVIFDGGKYGIIDDESYMQRMIAKHVLGYASRRLPRKGNPFLLDAELEKEKEWNETSLFDFIKNLMDELHGCKKEDYTVAKSMKNGTFRIGKHSVYYKNNNKVLSLPYEPDDENETHLCLFPLDRWYYPRSRKISKKEISIIQLDLDSFLKKSGYTYSYDTIYDELSK